MKRVLYWMLLGNLFWPWWTPAADVAESSFIQPTAFTGPRPFSFWLAEHDLSAGEDAAREDEDGDGVSHLEEYYRGTDPRDRLSRLPLVGVSLQSGRVVITHRRSLGSRGVDWRLFAAVDLDDPDWQAMPSEDMEITIQATNAWEDIRARLPDAPAGARFYKLELTETNIAPAVHDFGAWNPAADGVTDDGPKFKAFWTQVKAAGGGRVRIPPGTYLIEVAATNQAPIPSNVEIDATGAEFRFSEIVPSRTVFTWLYDFDVTDFIWRGGTFVGHAFDPALDPHTLNPWPPNAHVRCVHIRTTSGGRTANILFDGVTTEGIQGTAITVAGKWTPTYQVDTYATNVTMRGLRMTRTGPFLWDYGYLWQRLVWDYEYDDNHRSLARTYMDPKVIQLPVTASAGTRIEFNNSNNLVRVSFSDDLSQRVCFYGDKVDSSLVRGQAYVVLESGTNHIEVSATLGGEPIVLAGDGSGMRLMYDLKRAINRMLHPYPSVSGEAAHGAYMVSAAVGVRGVDCRLENGNGDAMLIHTSRDVVFSGNVIEGARMGAVWVGDRCENVVVRGNYVDGGNGSRILSVERLSKDVVVADNEFLNGGRGTWINLTRGILISNNVFHPNTGKNTPDPDAGARSWQNGQYDLWDQIYFTGVGEVTSAPITIVDNVIDSGTSNVNVNVIRVTGAVPDILIAGNAFLGDARFFQINHGVERLVFGPNTGILTTNWGNFRWTVDVPTAQARIPHGLADNSYYLNAVPTLTPRNAASAVAGFAVDETAIVVNLAAPAPPGTTLDIDWTAYLKWK